MTVKDSKSGRVTIGSKVFELPSEEASTLAEAALILTKSGGWLSPNDDLLIAVTPHTPITVDRPRKAVVL